MSERHLRHRAALASALKLNGNYAFFRQRLPAERRRRLPEGGANELEHCSYIGLLYHIFSLTFAGAPQLRAPVSALFLGHSIMHKAADSFEIGHERFHACGVMKSCGRVIHRRHQKRPVCLTVPRK